MNAFCVSCKEKREMSNAKNAVAKNGRHMMRGECVNCGTKMCKFVSSSANGGAQSKKSCK